MSYGPRFTSRLLTEERLEVRSVHIWEAPNQRRIIADVERAIAALVGCWPTEFRDTGNHREALWRAQLALRSASSGEFRIAFIVAAAEAGILAPGAVTYDCLPDVAFATSEKLAAE